MGFFMISNINPTARALRVFALRDSAYLSHGHFVSDLNAPYAGPNSLTPDRGKETTDLTVFLGARLWQGAEIWITPEIDQGFGLNNTLGVAGFPSGEAYDPRSDFLNWSARMPGVSRRSRSMPCGSMRSSNAIERPNHSHPGITP
jgi:hypothetical protein